MRGRQREEGWKGQGEGGMEGGRTDLHMILKSLGNQGCDGLYVHIRVVYVCMSTCSRTDMWTSEVAVSCLQLLSAFFVFQSFSLAWLA